MNYKIYLYLFPDGKAYVGMTKNSLEERRDMGYQHNKPLQRAIRKYGWGMNGFVLGKREVEKYFPFSMFLLLTIFNKSI